MSLKSELTTLGVEVHLLQADFSKPEQASDLIEQGLTFGPLFALVNSAAIFQKLDLETSNLQNWQLHLDINLTAPFLLSQAFWKAARQTGAEGRIVNILDWRALRPGADHLPYTISKAALAARPLGRAGGSGANPAFPINRPPVHQRRDHLSGRRKTPGVSMDKIIIKDLVVHGIIGVNDWEREEPQDILINVEIAADLSKAAASDNLEDSLNYRTLSKQLIAHAETAKRLTVEALAADLAAICLAQPGAQSARVRVEKPGALRFARSVGVEIERGQTNRAK